MAAPTPIAVRVNFSCDCLGRLEKGRIPELVSTLQSSDSSLTALLYAVLDMKQFPFQECNPCEVGGTVDRATALKHRASLEKAAEDFSRDYHCCLTMRWGPYLESHCVREKPIPTPRWTPRQAYNELFALINARYMYLDLPANIDANEVGMQDEELKAVTEKLQSLHSLLEFIYGKTDVCMETGIADREKALRLIDELYKKGGIKFNLVEFFSDPQWNDLKHTEYLFLTQRTNEAFRKAGKRVEEDAKKAKHE